MNSLSIRFVHSRPRLETRPSFTLLLLCFFPVSHHHASKLESRAMSWWVMGEGKSGACGFQCNGDESKKKQLLSKAKEGRRLKLAVFTSCTFATIAVHYTYFIHVVVVHTVVGSDDSAEMGCCDDDGGDKGGVVQIVSNVFYPSHLDKAERNLNPKIIRSSLHAHHLLHRI